jgi:hypothetical protein
MFMGLLPLFGVERGFVLREGFEAEGAVETEELPEYAEVYLTLGVVTQHLRG